jgi:formiminoglutamase
LFEIELMNDLHEFLHPVDRHAINDDRGYNDGQLGNFIRIYEEELPDLEGVDIVIAGVNEYRGGGADIMLHGTDAIRRELYQLHSWHQDVSIADIGNIRAGASLQDSYAAIKTVVAELRRFGCTVVLIGGSHDCTLAQYFAHKDAGEFIEATVVDSLINLSSDSSLRSENFLMELLTSEPNHVHHYNHIGFQSYFVHPRMLETIDKLRFDCFRVGMAREQIDEMEPVIRNSNLLSVDLAAIKHSDAPGSGISPNGFTGEDMCSLMQFAGMSPSLTSAGIYGYNTDLDEHQLTAKQVSQMLWYFIDGKSRSKQEAAIQDKDQFNMFHTAFTDIDATFFQSKKTGRWWMELPDKKVIACSYKDYMLASNNEIPERWLRAQERQ